MKYLLIIPFVLTLFSSWSQSDTTTLHLKNEIQLLKQQQELNHKAYEDKLTSLESINGKLINAFYWVISTVASIIVLFLGGNAWIAKSANEDRLRRLENELKKDYTKELESASTKLEEKINMSSSQAESRVAQSSKEAQLEITEHSDKAHQRIEAIIDYMDIFHINILDSQYAPRTVSDILAAAFGVFDIASRHSGGNYEDLMTQAIERAETFIESTIKSNQNIEVLEFISVKMQKESQTVDVKFREKCLKLISELNQD